MKILFFDMWLKGVANFNRLMPEIKKRPGVEALMLHTGSWIEPQEAAVHEHDGFQSRDISYYNTWSIYEVLKKEKPDVVVMLNLYWLVDMAIAEMCRKLGIRVVYLSHGRFSASAANDVNPERKKKTLRERLTTENINKVRNYAKASLLAGKPWRVVKTLYDNWRRPETMSLNSPYNPEMEVDDIILFYESDKRILTEERGFPDRNIHVVGNPEFDAIFDSPKVLRKDFLLSLGLDEEKPYLLYLDDGFVQNGYIAAKDWMAHLASMVAIARQSGLQFVLKLHPRTDIEPFKAFFQRQGITCVAGQCDFYNLLRHSEAVTSLVSTTISYALVLGRPVISPRWSVTRDISRSYPDTMVKYAESPTDFLRILKKKEYLRPKKEEVYATYGNPDHKAIPEIVSIIMNEKNG